MKKMTVILTVALFLGMLASPLVQCAEVPVEPNAVTQINVPTTWVTDQTNTDGFQINSWLWIDAPNSTEPDGNIDIIFGTGGAGSFVITDSGGVIVNTTNSHFCYLQGGANGTSQANNLDVSGILQTNYLGSDNTTTFFIGRDEDGNKTVDTGTYLRPQKNQKITNTHFISDAAYQLIAYVGGLVYFKDCKFGDYTEAYTHQFNGQGEMWFEDCDFRATVAAAWYNAYGGMINFVGDTQLHGRLPANGGALDNYRFWGRLFPEVQDTDGNPIDNATVTVMDSYGYECMGGWTNATGIMDKYKTKFNIPYLLGLNYWGVWGTDNDLAYWDGNTWINVSTDSNPSIITVTADGYYANITTHNMTSDWGNATVPATIELEPIPSIANGNCTVRTYATNATANYTSRFATVSTVYVNGTVTLSEQIDNVHVNVSIYNATDAYVAGLLDTTQDFPADALVNLTDLAGGVLNWTPTDEGQFYAMLWVNGTDVEAFNVTEDFQILDILHDGNASGGSNTGSGTYLFPDQPEEEGNGTWSGAGMWMSENALAVVGMIFLAGLAIILLAIVAIMRKKKRNRHGR